MSSEFGQFCPMALASETLAQKWTLLPPTALYMTGVIGELETSSG